MKTINHQVINITPSFYDKQQVYNFIEQCGRICYNSNQPQTNESGTKFYNMLLRNNHTSVLEHGTLYLVLPIDIQEQKEIVDFFVHNKYSRVNTKQCNIKHRYGIKYTASKYYVTTNYRVIEQGMPVLASIILGGEDAVYTDASREIVWNWLGKYMNNEPTTYHTKRVSYKVVTDIGVSRELNRHRCLSITEQSTRFIDFSHEKHSNCCGFVDYPWRDETPFLDLILKEAFIVAGDLYTKLRSGGWLPQKSRKLLPLGTSTTVIYTAFEDDWLSVMSLRSPLYGAKGVHPEAAIIGDTIYRDLKDRTT